MNTIAKRTDGVFLVEVGISAPNPLGETVPTGIISPTESPKDISNALPIYSILAYSDPDEWEFVGEAPAQFADFYDLAGRLEYATKKPSSTAPKKKNCTKGVYCIGKTGKGSCVKAGNKCRLKANQKSQDYTSAIGPVAAKKATATKATAPKTEVTPTADATPKVSPKYQQEADDILQNIRKINKEAAASGKSSDSILDRIEYVKDLPMNADHALLAKEAKGAFNSALDYFGNYSGSMDSAVKNPRLIALATIMEQHFTKMPPSIQKQIVTTARTKLEEELKSGKASARIEKIKLLVPSLGSKVTN